MPPKLQSIEKWSEGSTHTRFDLKLTKLELNMLVFHYFNEVDTLKRIILEVTCFIVLGA